MGAKTKLGASLVVLMMGFSLVACGNSPAVQPPANDTEEQQPAPEQPQAQESAVKETEGILTGWADPHTVEIRVNGEPMAFQVGEDVQKMFDDIDDEDTVHFKYVEKTFEGDTSIKQLVLKDIAKINTDDEATAGGTDGSEGANRAGKAKLEVTVEGMTEERPVTLARGDGYSLYVFEPMAFNASESALTMKIDPEYVVNIEQLPADFNLDQLTMDAKEELSETGEVRELSKEELAKGPMADARLYMMAQNEHKSQYFIVKELDGHGFVFRIDAPVGEPSEGFLPMAYASLNSIKNNADIAK